MNILPKFLFVFQNLIIKILQNILVKIPKAFTKFMWHYRKTRIRLSTLQMKTEKDGIAVPNVTTYYHTDYLMQWNLNYNTSRYIEQLVLDTSLSQCEFMDVNLR